MKKLHALLAALALTAGLGLAAPGPALAAAPYCGITWGSQAKTNSSMTSAPITNVRAGRHACFDRLVIDIKGKGAGYDVRYVSQVTSQGSGLPVALRGGAKLNISVHAPAYDSKGHATYKPANPKEAVNVCGFTTFRQVRYVGSFEGYTQFGLGVRARLPFRVFTLAGPGSGTRLVIDVAHRW